MTMLSENGYKPNRRVINENLQSEIESRVQSELDNEDKQLREIVAKTREEVKRGETLSFEDFDTVVRSARQETINRHVDIKRKLLGNVIDGFHTEIQTSQIAELVKINNLRYNTAAENEKAAKEVEHIQADKENLNDYEKYIQYSQIDVVKTAYEKFNNVGMRRRIFGIIVVLLCAATDYFMLYNVFILGNLGRLESMLSAFIFSLVLDVPPYVIGWVITLKNENERLHEITDSSLKNRGYNMAIRILFAILMLALFFYVFVRVISFWGNGDFGEAFRSLFAGNLDISNRYFSAADLLSSIVPLTTSVVSFVIGLFLFSSFTDFLTDVAIKIDKSLDDEILKKQEDIEKKNGDLKTAEALYSATRQTIWMHYMGSTRAVTEDESQFYALISSEIKKSNLPQYLMVYRSCSRKILAHAIHATAMVRDGLASSAANPKSIMVMVINKDEQSRLDTIWVDGGTEIVDSSSDAEDRIQHVDTKKEIKQIQDMVDNHIKRLTQ